MFVSAERRSGWNNTVAEAMACGVPVLCTRSGTQDLARHLDTAWVARWRHPWFLQPGLAALARDAALRQRLARRGRERVQRFGWNLVADRVEAVARAGLARRPLPRPLH